MNDILRGQWPLWVALVCCVLLLLVVVVILADFFNSMDWKTDMGDKSAVDSLKDGTAIVIVNYIAKSGQRQGHTFHNVDPGTLQAVLSLLDHPQFAPVQQVAYEAEPDGTIHAVNPNE